MTVKYSEGKVREALLAAMDLEEIHLYKPVDVAGGQNPKPADFMAWWSGEYLPSAAGVDVARSAWIEVKQSPSARTFPLREVRASQRQGMRVAQRVGLPYWLAVYWPSGITSWTITRGIDVLAALDVGTVSLRRGTGAGAFLVECLSAQLGSMLRACLLGEYD